jgi:hypothetical protein
VDLKWGDSASPVWGAKARSGVICAAFNPFGLEGWRAADREPRFPHPGTGTARVHGARGQ